MSPKFTPDGRLLEKFAQSEIQFKKENKRYTIHVVIDATAMVIILLAVCFIQNVTVLRPIIILCGFVLTASYFWNRKRQKEFFDALYQEINEKGKISHR